MHDRIGLRPSPVQIEAGKGAPRVSYDHTVWVDHWDYFYYVVVEYFVILFVVMGKFLQDLSHDQGAVGLCGVKPRLDVHYLFLFVLYGMLLLLRKGQLVNIETTNALSYHLLSVK